MPTAPPPAVGPSPLVPPTYTRGQAGPGPSRRDSLLSGPALTAVVAIVIVLALAIIGIIAGQALSG